MLPKLYLITDRSQCSNLLDTVEAALKGGLRMIQLREKDLSSNQLFNLALKIKKLTEKYNAYLIINDRIDVAFAVEADGIHVGKKSIPVSVLRKLTSDHKRKLLIGYSAHSLKEALAVQQERADWITFSPIFKTYSKEKYDPPQGITRLKEIVDHLSIPVYALGGINLTNISELLNVGAHGIALVSEIMQSENPQQKTETLISKL